LSDSGKNLHATATGKLQLYEALSPSTQETLVLQDLKTGTLISMSQLYDDNQIALLAKYDIKIDITRLSSLLNVNKMTCGQN